MKETINYASWSDKLYYLQIVMIKHFFIKQQTLLTIHDNKILRITWHQHFRHLEDSILEWMMNNFNIHNINFQDLKKQSSHLCKMYLVINQKC
jgi:hypothetical protein